MKLQYLGDSKDSFKWDYLDFLVCSLGFPQLQILWMMTPDDDGSDGKTAPELFPARPEILGFCNSLRSRRDPAAVFDLPALTSAPYSIKIHNPNMILTHRNRDLYFSGIHSESDSVLFADPDNGFEPECSCCDKHIRFADVENVIRRISADSAITVFQHFRRRNFKDDFAAISSRLISGYSTALYWHSLMFVTISPSESTILRVEEINRVYAQTRPVAVLN